VVLELYFGKIKKRNANLSLKTQVNESKAEIFYT